MAVIKATEEEVKLLARLMRAEAESEGQKGMLMVGNVGVNRVRARCLDFKNIRTVEDMVFQRPGGFEATLFSYFYHNRESNSTNLNSKYKFQRLHQYSTIKTLMYSYFFSSIISF